ncbi:MAG: helix-turn-helix domain-containing protein [Clostridia bacterium]|nr:helix-turn-helix domain-containing protein [Clostridia bacterium]
MKLGDIIKRYCEENGLSQRSFASKAGLSNTYIAMLFKGANTATGQPIQPSLPTIKKIAEAMDSTLDALLRQMDDEIVNMGTDATDLSHVANLIPISDLHMHKIPLLGSVAAGEPIYDPEFTGIIVESPTDADFALKIRGDSMEPDFLDGDLVFVKLLPDIPHDGCVCVMAIDDEATLKRVYRQQDGVMLLSNNPMYSPMCYKFSEHAIRVLGVPVGFTRMLIK